MGNTTDLTSQCFPIQGGGGAHRYRTPHPPQTKETVIWQLDNDTGAYNIVYNVITILGGDGLLRHHSVTK